MRTTVNVDEEILATARRRALERKVPLSRVVEDALRESLSRPCGSREPVRLVTSPGSGVRPGVDLDDSRSLLEVMDEQS